MTDQKNSTVDEMIADAAQQVLNHKAAERLRQSVADGTITSYIDKVRAALSDKQIDFDSKTFYKETCDD